MSNFYYCPGSGKIRAHRCTLVERFQMWRRMRRRMKEWIV